MIYLDNAATSWPKPPGVLEAMARFLTEVGANPGRSGHRLSVEAGRIVYAAREAVAELFHAPDPLRVVFGMNATEGINLALRGLLRPGDHVVTSSMEHNSVMRPLRALEREGVEVTVVPCSPEGALDPQAVPFGPAAPYPPGRPQPRLQRDGDDSTGGGGGTGPAADERPAAAGGRGAERGRRPHRYGGRRD